MSTNLKDSGTRQSFRTGAVRDAQGIKGRFDLIPFWPILAYAAVLEAGAKKYDDNNWRKGMPISRYLDCAERHMGKFKAGFRDEPHLWQALWNIAGAVHSQVQTYFGKYPVEFNDLYSDLANDPSNPVELLSQFEKDYLAAYAPMMNPGITEKAVTKKASKKRKVKKASKRKNA
jgi:hypothetical protein